eukprot:TRINITY_DN110_c0_g2_i18.p1 TRINITY_DN110_c0_g2~~TRINITY_DN110_c0_g2_i18.p1  ORF type:complete len:127 (+),score=15.15 TRINITY_DN110_c0_g2_i18:417-797(+)
MAWIGSDEVLDANTVVGRAAASSCRNSSCFLPRFSTIASITRSAPATAATPCVDVLMLHPAHHSRPHCETTHTAHKRRELRQRVRDCLLGCVLVVLVRLLGNAAQRGLDRLETAVQRLVTHVHHRD